MNIFQILERMEMVCPNKCYCSVHKSGFEIILKWEFYINKNECRIATSVHNDEFLIDEKAIERSINKMEVKIKDHIKQFFEEKSKYGH